MILSSLNLVSLLVVAASALPGITNPPAKRANTIPWDEVNAALATDPSTFKSYHTGGLVRAPLTNSTGLNKRCVGQATFTWGDIDNGGPGIQIGNNSPSRVRYYFYENSCDYIPYKFTELAPGEFAYFSFPAGWAGRLVQGTDAENLNGQPQLLGTWFEFSFDSNNVIWGDVSLIRGCDGPVFMFANDGSGAWKGFIQDIITNAPAAAKTQKPDGQWVIMNTENNDGSINTVARDWDLNQVGADKVYVDDYHGNPVIASSDGRFNTVWSTGFP